MIKTRYEFKSFVHPVDVVYWLQDNQPDDYKVIGTGDTSRVDIVAEFEEEDDA